MSLLNWLEKSNVKGGASTENKEVSKRKLEEEHNTLSQCDDHAPSVEQSDHLREFSLGTPTVNKLYKNAKEHIEHATTGFNPNPNNVYPDCWTNDMYVEKTKSIEWFDVNKK